MSTDKEQSTRTATAFTIATETPAANGNVAVSAIAADATDDSSSDPVLPDRLRKRLQAERKCRPTNEQLDQKLARAEQRRQKQFAKRAASAREAEDRCRHVAEAMEALHARRPDSRAQVMGSFSRLQRDLQLVLGRFNSEVEQTNCDLFAGAPLLAFSAAVQASPMTTQPHHQRHQHHQHHQHHQQATAAAAVSAHKRGSTAFEVANPVAAAEAASDMPARLKQRLAAYPRRREHHELKVALEKKLEDAQQRKERYERRRAESIKETEERCRRISETMEEISLAESSSDASSKRQQPSKPSSKRHQQQQQRQQQAATAQDSASCYNQVARLQVDLDCLFTKFNREFVTVRGRPIDLMAGLTPPQQLQLNPSVSSVACQTEAQRCCSCGCDPNSGSGNN